MTYNFDPDRWLEAHRAVLETCRDRGEIDVLETQMALLKRKAYKIIWLNPLMGTTDYQPICQGMRTALPYVDSFLPMDNLRDIAFLGRMLEKIFD